MAVIEYWMVCPAITEAGPVFTIDRSASITRGVLMVCVLLDGSGSGTVEVTLAVLESGLPATFVTTPRISRVNVAGCRMVPIFREPLHVLHDPPSLTEYSALLVNNGLTASVITTPAASLGPALNTAIVYSTGLFFRTGDVLQTLERIRSAEPPMGVITEELLLLRSGSGVVLLVTVAVLDMDPLAPGTRSPRI